ncbi:MAG: hypothetical protein WCK51_11685 [Armatimonadota bacterium]
MKLCHLFGILFLTAFGLGQDPIAERRKVLAAYPGFQFEAVKSAVPAGSPASKATIRYGDPVTIKHGSTLTGVGTTSVSWPELGVYQALSGRVHGVMYDIDMPTMSGSTESQHLMFDGKVGYWHLFDKSGKGRSTVQVDQSGRQMSDGLFTDVWEPLGDPLGREMSLKRSRVDPAYGVVLIYNSPSGEYEFAKERDWNCLKRTYGPSSVEITKLIKVDTYWLPEEIKETRGGMDIICTVTYKPVAGLTAKDFAPKKVGGMLWIENNVYYDVVGGKLVKSKRQPDRTSEYLSWAGMGAVTLLVLGGLGHQAHKLFGKSNGSLFDSQQGTKDDEKNV